MFGVNLISVIIMRVFMLSVIMIRAIMLSVIMVNVVMLYEGLHAESHYVCHI